MIPRRQAPLVVVFGIIGDLTRWSEGASTRSELSTKNRLSGDIYSRVPITRHGMFIRHTPCIWPDTFTKRWDMMFNRIRTKRKRAVPFNWITLFWSVSILRGVFPYEPLLVFGSCHSKWQLWLIFHPIHFQSCEPLLLFSTWHKRSGEPLCLFRTPLLIGTRE